MQKQNKLKSMLRLVAMLTVSVIITLTFITGSKAVDIDEGKIPQLISVDGPQTATSEESVTVSSADLQMEEGEFFNGAIVDDITVLFNSFTVYVEVYGKQYEIETSGGRVYDAVIECFDIKEGDLVNYKLDDPLFDGMKIVVTDIEYVTEVKQVELDYKTDVVYSDKHYSGQITQVAGEKGLKEYTYRYKYVNGEIADTELISEKVVREPKNAQNIVGTKNASKTYMTSGVNYVSGLTPSYDFALDDNYRPVSYSKLMTGTASAYSSDPYTATGKRCRTGYVAVNPKIIPYHTKMYIVCADNSYFYGYASAEDTGGFIHWGTRIVDLYFDTEAECEVFGLRKVEMYLF